jgi:hypothetical protein
MGGGDLYGVESKRKGGRGRKKKKKKERKKKKDSLNSGRIKTSLSLDFWVLFCLFKHILSRLCY